MLITYAILIGAVAIAGSAGYLAVSGFSQASAARAERARVRARTASRDEEATSLGGILGIASMLLQPKAVDRIARSLASRLAVFDRAGIAQDPVRIRRAGLLESLSEQDLLAMRAVLGLVLGGMLALLMLNSSIIEALMFGSLGVFLGVRLISFAIAARADARAAQCVRDLPTMIDMIALASAAGMSFDRALEMYTERFEGPLSDEFGDALRQWRFGAMGRDEAIEALGARMQVDAVARFCASVTQALRLGSPLAKVLREQGAEARTAQRLSVEEQIAKAPVKMLGPMGGLILPAMLVLLLGPIGLRFLTGGF